MTCRAWLAVWQLDRISTAAIVHRLLPDLEADKQIKYQKRCIDRETCATARGGKS